MKVEPSKWDECLFKNKQRQLGASLCSPPCEATARGWLSVNQQEGPHKAPNPPPP